MPLVGLAAEVAAGTLTQKDAAALLNPVAAAPAAPASIPHVFHFIWLGDKPLPTPTRAFMAGWKRKHPRWKLRLWTDADLPGFPFSSPAMAALYRSNANVGWRSDLLRYEILYRFGGVYADVDMECVHPIGGIIAPFAAFVPLVVMRPGWEAETNNGLLGATPGHPFYRYLLARLPDWATNTRAARTGNVIWQTGPHALRQMLRDWRGQEAEGITHDVTLFPPHIFMPHTWDHRNETANRFPAALTRHHWWGTWTDEKTGYSPYSPYAFSGSGTGSGI